MLPVSDREAIRSPVLYLYTGGGVLRSAAAHIPSYNYLDVAVI